MTEEEHEMLKEAHSASKMVHDALFGVPPGSGKDAKPLIEKMRVIASAWELARAALSVVRRARRVNDHRWLVTIATGLWTSLIIGYYVATSYEQGRMRNDDV